jgi:hypothetical protein
MLSDNMILEACHQMFFFKSYHMISVNMMLFDSMLMLIVNTSYLTRETDRPLVSVPDWKKERILIQKLFCVKFPGIKIC